MSHSHRLTSAQNRLGRRFEQHTAEPDRPGQTGCGPGREPTGLPEQLFHSRDQLANDGCIPGPGGVEIVRYGMILLSIGGHRCGKLELVYLLVRTLAVRPHRLSVAFIVDDENSRNASDVGGDSRQKPRDPPGEAIRDVAAERRGRHGYGGYDTVRGRINRELR